MPAIIPISVDRFLAVVMPLRHRKLKGSRVFELVMIAVVFGPTLFMTLIRVTTMQLGLTRVRLIIGTRITIF